MADAEQKRLSLEEVELITSQALIASGLSATAAQAITDVVTQAERDECHSHGLFRVPGYCSGVLAGKVKGTVQPVVYDVAPGVVRVDARGGYAPPAILAGREAAVAKRDRVELHAWPYRTAPTSQRFGGKLSRWRGKG